MDYKTACFVIAAVALYGCAGTSEQSQFADTPYIEKMGPGEIRYLNEGASYTRKARREDVYEKIAESCNGDFRIIKEGVMTKSGNIHSQTSLDNYPNARYVHIKYVCSH